MEEKGEYDENSYQESEHYLQAQYGPAMSRLHIPKESVFAFVQESGIDGAVLTDSIIHNRQLSVGAYTNLLMEPTPIFQYFM